MPSEATETPTMHREDPLPGTFEQVVSARRSVRAFLPEPLPQEMLDHLFTVAGKSPSNCNVQPWITHVLSGDALERMKQRLIAEAAVGETSSDVPITDYFVEHYRERRIGSAVALFKATGVERHDAEARQFSYMRNFHFFDAPHVAFFFMKDYFGLREAVDIGMYVQTLMLALTAHGYGSCAQGSISHYAASVKRELGVPDDLVCLFGLSFGKPDESHASCAAITDRAPLAETVRFHV